MFTLSPSLRVSTNIWSWTYIAVGKVNVAKAQVSLTRQSADRKQRAVNTTHYSAALPHFRDPGPQAGRGPAHYGHDLLPQFTHSG